MVRKSGLILCLIAMVAMLGCATWAGEEECPEPGLLYTGDLFDKFGATRFCAQVTCDPCECRPEPLFLKDACLWFQAWDLWDIRRTNGEFSSVYTNAVGKACDPQNFGSGVFEVQGFGCDGGLLDGVQAPPVAVTVFNCKPGIGIAAGGAVMLDTCKKFRCTCETCEDKDRVTSKPPPPDENHKVKCGCIDYSCRRATFGLYYDIECPKIDPRNLLGDDLVGKPKPIEIDFCFDLCLPNGKTEQLLFLDPCNPDGAVKIKATNFRTATLPIYAKIHLYPFPIWWYVRFEGLKVTGYCEYTANGCEPKTKYFEALLSHNYTILSKSPYFKYRDASFCIRVWEYPNKTLYEACGPIEDGGSQIF